MLTRPSSNHSSLVAETEELRIAYEERGPADGPPVLLLHGWPDDVRTWDAVAAPLAKAGFRTVAPYLRGFGPTRFRNTKTPRTGQPVALANDVVQLMQALDIEKATVVGHDWGGRIGYALAALWPERVERLVVMSVGYVTGVPDGASLDWEQQHAYWYQWFFGSERAREALEGNRREVCRYLWKTWAPSMNFTQEEFETTAASWDNPDWVDVTLHSYRVRWGNAATDEFTPCWNSGWKHTPRSRCPRSSSTADRTVPLCQPRPRNKLRRFPPTIDARSCVAWDTSSRANDQKPSWLPCQNESQESSIRQSRSPPGKPLSTNEV